MILKGMSPSGLLESVRKHLCRLRGEMVFYPGYHCGCCGRWIVMRFGVRKYRSLGERADTWGLCPKCSAIAEKENPSTSSDPGI
jgi:hypothetical protein